MLSKPYYLSTYTSNEAITFVIDNSHLNYIHKRVPGYFYVTLSSVLFKDNLGIVSESLKKLLFLKNLSTYQELTSHNVLILKNLKELEKAMFVIFIFLEDKKIYFNRINRKECKTYKEMLEEIEKYIAKD